LIASLVDVEIRKLRGSLALPMALLASALPGLLVALSLTVARDPPPWDYLFQRFAIPMWGVFLFPMSVALLTVVVAQLEYRSHAWDHVLALPIVRWQLFVSKGVVALAAAVGMTILAMLFTGLGGLVGGALSGHFPEGGLNLSALSNKIALFLAGSILLVVLQLWASLRFRNFIVPLTVGIIGTLVGLSVFMTGVDRATWFPWVLPIKVLSAARPEALALAGFAGGVGAFAVMVLDLSRRYFR
jgi:hypothetical protein